MHFQRPLIKLFLLVFLSQGLYAASTKTLEEVQKIPFGALAIPQCSLAEEKEIIKLLPPKDADEIFSGKSKIYADGIMDNVGDNIEIYKGNFSNAGDTEYLFLAEGGSMGTSTVVGVYRLINNRLVKLNYDDILSQDILDGNDLSRFYMWMPKPIAYVKDRKTYIRYMDSPSLVCDYLWQDNHMKLIGPDNCIGKKKRK